MVDSKRFIFFLKKILLVLYIVVLECFRGVL